MSKSKKKTAARKKKSEYQRTDQRDRQQETHFSKSTTSNTKQKEPRKKRANISGQTNPSLSNGEKTGIATKQSEQAGTPNPPAKKQRSPLELFRCMFDVRCWGRLVVIDKDIIQRPTRRFGCAPRWYFRMEETHGIQEVVNPTQGTCTHVLLAL